MDCNHSSSNRSITKSSSKLIETVDENCSKQCCFSLPFIVTKKILSHLNYYQMLQLRLVCKYWQSAVDDYIMTSNHSFLNKFLLYRLEWVLVKQQIENYSASMNRSKKLRAIPKMSARIHFLSCCVDDSLYIFGGCGNILRCYNDLWRFDIENKMWHRIIPEGDLPLPRLYASFNYYEQCDKKTGEKSKYIVLYGGISQFRRNERKELEDALDTIHLFDINQNRWRLVSIKGKINLKSSKHFATIIGDELIVSGGRRYANGKKITKEAIYVFDLKKQYWRCQYHVWSTNLYTTNSNFDILNPFFSIEDIEFSKFFAPNSFVLDDHHILYVGFSLDDVTDSKTFLLELNKNHTNTCDKCTNAYENGTQSSCTWIWHPIDINLRNFDFTSGQFCKIGNWLIFLSMKYDRFQAMDIFFESNIILFSREFPWREIDTYAPRLTNEDSILNFHIFDISNIISERTISYKLLLRPKIDSITSCDPMISFCMFAVSSSIVLFSGCSVKNGKRNDSSESFLNKLFLLVSRP